MADIVEWAEFAPLADSEKLYAPSRLEFARLSDNRDVLVLMLESPDGERLNIALAVVTALGWGEAISIAAREIIEDVTRRTFNENGRSNDAR